MPKTIHVPAIDIFDNERYQFITTKPADIVIEHSLISISKWESKWHTSFLKATEDKTLTNEQIEDYIKFMTIGRLAPDDVYHYMPVETVEEIFEYINDPMTGTTIKDLKKPTGAKPIITNELVYCWMANYQLPFEVCEKWHFNRLMMLIRVCEEKSNPKQMSRKETADYYKALNAARRAKYHTKG